MLTPIYTSAAASNRLNHEKRLSKTARASLFFLRGCQGKLRRNQGTPGTYSFSRTASATAWLPVLKDSWHQNRARNHCINKGNYLLGERSDIPAAYAFKISDLNLKILELHNSDSIEPHIKKYQSPLEERVNGVGCSCQVVLWHLYVVQDSPPATWCTLC